MSPARRSSPPRPKRVDVPKSASTEAGAPDIAGVALASDAAPLLGNGELALVFYEIADMLEIGGDLPFKIAAYRRAAETIAHAPMDVARAYRAGTPPRLPGVGKAIDEKLAELAATGRLEYHARLARDVPPKVVELLEVPGLGPRTAGELWRQAGIGSVDELEAAARAGLIRGIKGMSEKSEQRLLEGIAELRARPPRRMRLGEATEIVERLSAAITAVPGVQAVVGAGSWRRRRETIADIDLLVTADGPADSAALRAALPRDPRGPHIDLMSMPATAAGTYLVHFTGSAAHNARLRQIARDKGWSLSEHGFTALNDESKRLTFATEQEVYGFLDLPWIAPELREDRGEIEAAQGGSLPVLVERSDLCGDCHTHSEWSDGHFSIERMAAEAITRGLRYQVLTDHSQSLGIANGLDPARVEQQRRVIGELNEGYAREGTDFRLLHGCELEIRTDGRLDYEDELLARFDVVVASLHVGRKQPRAQLMARYRTALRSPHVDIIAHPSGRKIGTREDLDLDWEAFYREAAETHTVLEMNGSDERLDLSDRRARAALDAGNRFVLDSDAHYVTEFGNLDWAVSQARRAWLTKHDVLNALEMDDFLNQLDKPRS